jgi:fructosamine-3-kinase
MSFVKTDPAPLEAAGLRWLADAGARVPAIIEDSPRRLVLTRIAPGRLDADGEEGSRPQLSRACTGPARRMWVTAGDPILHVGRCELDSPLDAADDWNAYYLQHRCLPLANRVGLSAVVERVRVDAPPEPPARLHGDLWSGNILADVHGQAWLIDPAAYGGHREMDLAMLDLFGRIPARTVAAYQEVVPFADGRRERIGLWQLFPLLVHAVLFDGGYLSGRRGSWPGSSCPASGATSIGRYSPSDLG